MTLNELLRELMKIKEVYPDSGNYKIFRFCPIESEEVKKIRKSSFYKYTIVVE